MKQYLELVREVLENGIQKGDRTGTGTLSLFGAQKKYDLREGFPLVTTKKVSIGNILRELLWFLKGATNINDGLLPHTHIWDDWADEKGELGPIYGYQWILWEAFRDDGKGGYKKNHINQVQQAIDLIKKDPNSRRILVTAWNPADLPRMALAPCHAFFQLYAVDGRLDLQLYQRSADIALGVPYNIASYSALLMMFAQECGLLPGIFTHTLGDAHIYLNHVDGLKEQLKRTPHPMPRVTLNKKSFWDIALEDFKLMNYTHDAPIRFPIAV
ncbi:thymidylate synthase [Candidatus Peregrinibacteria bacterium]|nr:thymidylate synthase [Candidatus Peregrinibacteria bacterium]